jgi:hypothetical protein
VEHLGRRVWDEQDLSDLPKVRLSVQARIKGRTPPRERLVGAGSDSVCGVGYFSLARQRDNGIELSRK